MPCLPSRGRLRRSRTWCGAPPTTPPYAAWTRPPPPTSRTWAGASSRRSSGGGGRKDDLVDIDRSALIRYSRWLLVFTLLYNVGEGIIAIGSGIVAGSIALVGFCLDSFIEGFAGGGEPQESSVGIGLAAASLLIMPALGLSKRACARRLCVSALERESVETLVCSYLSITPVLGLVLNAAWGLWWADPIAALAMVPYLLKEGREAWQGGGDDW